MTETQRKILNLGAALLFAGVCSAAAWDAGFDAALQGGIVTVPVSVSPRPLVPSASADPRGEMIWENVLILLNEERLEAGLKQVPHNQAADAAAQKWAERIDSEGECRHDPDNSRYGEVVSCGASTPRQAVEGWMESATHRDLILGTNLESIGIGISGDRVVVKISRKL